MMLLAAPKPRPHVFSFGGGASSFVGAIKTVERYGRDSVDVVMAALEDDERDDERLDLEFERITGKKVTRVTIHDMGPGGVKSVRVLADGEPAPYSVWDIFFYTGMMGSTYADPCSRVLKREVLSHYMQQWHGSGFTTLHVGITADEIDRMLAIQRNWAKLGFKVNAPLVDDETITRDSLNAELERLIGYVPTLYREGRLHKNCGGACVKAGHGEWARLLWYRPLEFQRWEINELWHQKIHDHTSTILRDQTYTNKRVQDKKSGLCKLVKVYDTKPLTLRAFRDRMHAKWAQRLPGFEDPFANLDDTPGCRFCDSAA